MSVSWNSTSESGAGNAYLKERLRTELVLVQVHSIQAPLKHAQRFNLLERAGFAPTQQLQGSLQIPVGPVHPGLLQEPQLTLGKPTPHLRQERSEPLPGVAFDSLVLLGHGVGDDVAISDKTVVVSQQCQRRNRTHQIVELTRLPEHPQAPLFVPSETNYREELTERRRNHRDDQQKDTETEIRPRVHENIYRVAKDLRVRTVIEHSG